MKNVIFTFIAFALMAVSSVVQAFQEEPLLPAGTRPRTGSPATVPTMEDVSVTPQTKKKPSPSAGAKASSKKPDAAKSGKSKVPPDVDVVNELGRVIDYANSHLADLRFQQDACTECYVRSAGGDETAMATMTDSKRQCVDKWADFYNTGPVNPNDPDGPKKPIDLRIVLGYLDEDVGSFVSDGVMRRSMVVTLTAPCKSDNLVRACGFKPSPIDNDVFEKEVTNPQGKLQKVRLTLKSSSSPSAEISKADQEIRSAAAEKTYFDGIRDADMLLYVGHARKGGGPDFRPAVRRANGTTDFDYYENKKPGLKAMLAAFDKAKVDGEKKTPKIMGFFACDADLWHKEVRENAPNSGLIFSRTKVIDIQRMMGMAYLTLDSVLWQRCRDEFDRALNTLIDYRKTKLMPLDLENFFPKKSN